MGFAHRAFVAAGVGFAASAIVGCGSSGGSLLSGAQADNLNRQLNRINAELDSRQCSQAQQDLQNFQTSIANMGGVNSTLISNLDQGVATVESLANDQCRTVVTTPKKTQTHTNTQTATTATQTTPTFTNASTDTYTQPTYTQPSDTTTSTIPGTATTSTTGGGCLTCVTSTTTATSTSTTTTTPTTSNTTPSGGGGLGGGNGIGSGTTTTSGSGF